MSQQTPTYLENKTESTITYEDEKIEIMFHRAKLKLNNELEVHLLKSINPEFNKEFTLTEDQLTLSIFPPPTYAFFNEIQGKSIQAKWQFAYNLIQRIQQHTLKRVKLIVSPENIMFDRGLMPHFLHYGVSESIPPYEDEPERLWVETRAIIATIADNKHDFESYLLHYETIDLIPITKQIMEAKSYEQLMDIIEENLTKDEAYEDTVIHVPKKKWNIRRYSIWVLAIFLIPTLIYTVFALFYKIPQTEAYVESNRSFLEDKYSSVIDTLQKYNHEKMPYIVQYQLASSYIVNESLTEDQKANVQNTITLQSDRKYFLYWINIGRGDYQEAIDTARLLEDRDLIVYGLLKQREEIKTDQGLDGAEREEKLDAIQKEIDEYEKEMEEEKKQIEDEAAAEKEEEAAKSQKEQEQQEENEKKEKEEKKKKDEKEQAENKEKK